MGLNRGFSWIIVAAMAAGCTGSSDDSSPTTPTAETSTTTTSSEGGASTTAVDDSSDDSLTAQELLDEMRDAGASDLEFALAELTAHIGPLPGVPTLTLDGSIHPTFTGPLLHAQHFRDEMTTAQREAFDDGIDELFDPSNVGAAFDTSGNDVVAGGRIRGLVASPPTTDAPSPACPTGDVLANPPATTVAPTPETRLYQRWRQYFEDASDYLAADFPGDLDVVVMISDPTLMGSGSAGTLTVEPEMTSERLTRLRACFDVHDCYIMIADTGASESVARMLAAHELFHCWHYGAVGKVRERMASASWWVIEGLANWVGETYSETDLAAQWWERYFSLLEEDHGRYNLFGESYSAIGLWSHVVNRTDHASFVRLIPQILQEGTDEDRNDLSVLALIAESIGDAGAAAIAAAPTQRDDVGPEWTTKGPGMRGGSRGEPIQLLGLTSAVRLSADPGVQLTREVLVDVDLEPDEGAIATTVLENYAILEWNDGETSVAGSERLTETRCIGVCECPDGTHVRTTLPDLDPSDPTFWVGLSGLTTAGATIDATLARPEDFCEDDDEPGSAGPSSRDPSRGGSFGHPNLVTFDGIAYVFHGAGDYAVVESATDDLAIHARYSRLNNMTGVSFNRAVAARVGDSVVTFGDDAESTAFDPAVVRVDGVAIDVDADAPAIAIGGVATLSQIGERFVLTWGDGTELRVGLRVGDEFDVLMPESRWGDVAGLLGNANSDVNDDVVTRNGDAVDPHDFEPFYAEFGASWLLAPADSFFTSTLDPVDIEPIVPSAQVTLGDLSPDLRAEAERVCRAGGVTPAFGLSQCIFDVAMTGDSSWIRSVLAMRDIIDGSVSVSALLANIEDESTSGSGGIVTGELSERFAADVVDIEVEVGSTLDVAAALCPETSTFEMTVISPFGHIIDRSRGGDCGALTLRDVTAPGTYRIAVYDVGGFTGDYVISLGVTELVVGDLVTIDEPFDFVIDGSGVSPAVSFEAQAGDHLRIEHPETDNDDTNLGFAQYRLIGPGGALLESWPLRDDRDIRIAVGGTYTLLLDIIVGVQDGTVTVLIASVGAAPPTPVEIGVPFTLEVASPGDEPLATFEADEGDRLSISNEAPELYFEAAATFQLLGPDGAELAWWFAFQDGEVEIPDDGTYTLSFETGTSEETSSFEVMITR